jgi:ketosteroid isomerase-like protein
MSSVGFLKGLYDSFGRGDVAAVVGAMHPQVKWHLAEGHPYMPSGEAMVGPDAVLSQVFMRIGADYDGFTVHPEVFHDAGQVVVVEARYTGRSKRTGLELDAQVCHVWTVADGKLTKFQQYLDTAQLRAVLGA